MKTIYFIMHLQLVAAGTHVIRVSRSHPTRNVRILWLETHTCIPPDQNSSLTENDANKRRHCVLVDLKFFVDPTSPVFGRK